MINAINYPNGLLSEYIYECMNRLIGLTNKLGANTLSTFNYTYDCNGNITSVTTGGQTTTYRYDPLNRLTGIKRPSGEEINYQYDSRGNRSKESVTTIDTGNFKAGTFEYNNWDELASFTGSGSTTTYSYDPEGLRTKKDTDTAVTRYFCDDNGLVIAESDGTGQVTAQNIWGHKALARKIGSNYYYYLYNGHGDVIQVIDEAGNTVNSYSYDEWGNILSSQEQISNPMKYAGEYFDDETGLYYLRARYYDPSIGRFISKDSVEGDIKNPLTINSYIYCLNNPKMYKDRTGHIPIPDTSGIIDPELAYWIEQRRPEDAALPEDQQLGTIDGIPPDMYDDGIDNNVTTPVACSISTDNIITTIKGNPAIPDAGGIRIITSGSPGIVGAAIGGDFLATNDGFQATGSRELNVGAQIGVSQGWQGVLTWNAPSSDDLAGDYNGINMSGEFILGASASISWSKEPNSSGKRSLTISIGPALGIGFAIAWSSGTTVK